MSTTSNTSDDDSRSSKREQRMAKKSTTAMTATKPVKNVREKSKRSSAKAAAEKFMGNFNPELSTREKRKLNHKLNIPPPNVRRPHGALYDEKGVHIITGKDMCDCLNEDCEGCFFECIKCGSQKCGTECRVHRKFLVDQIVYHGYDIVIQNPLPPPLHKNHKA